MAIAEEVVFEHWDGADQDKGPQEIIKGNDDAVKKLGCILRPTMMLCTVLGFWMLFAPIIAILKWIPLVGWLLGSIVSIAAFIFSLVVGTTLSCLVLGLAWLWYRPLIGILLLAAVAGGITLICMNPFAKDGDDNVDVN